MLTLAFEPLFRDLNRLTNELFGVARGVPQAMPMDAYRVGDKYVAEFDLPGIDPNTLEVSAENRTLTVRAERPAPRAGDGQEAEVNYLVAERPRGSFSRQLALGEGLDLDHVHADYTNGVLTVTLPVAEQAKPRRIEIGHGGGEHRVIESGTGGESG